MKSTFGKETTTLSSEISLVEAIVLLSGDAEAVLEKILLDMDTNAMFSESKKFVDDRGVEFVHDDEFNTDAIEELIESELVLVHPDSDSMVSYLSINNDVFKASIECGIYKPYEFV